VENILGFSSTPPGMTPHRCTFMALFSLAYRRYRLALCEKQPPQNEEVLIFTKTKRGQRARKAKFLTRCSDQPV
jgi:hypothetical protein